MKCVTDLKCQHWAESKSFETVLDNINRLTVFKRRSLLKSRISNLGYAISISSTYVSIEKLILSHHCSYLVPKVRANL